MKTELEVLLTAIDSSLAEAWHSICGDLPGVYIHEGDIFQTNSDAVVSPANSFGFMDGGIDAVYTRVFGQSVQRRLQTKIRERHHGELLVGQAEIVATDHATPFVIAAPTMRVPMILGETVNPYLAARAVFLLLLHGDLDDGSKIATKVRRVAFPGLATGVGRVAPKICARQVRVAYEEVILNQQHFPSTWFAAQERHQKLYRDAVVDLQYTTR
ncbi:MAG: macro domain-containing protein [Nannocystaceae bacterium]